MRGYAPVGARGPACPAGPGSGHRRRGGRGGHRTVPRHHAPPGRGQSLAAAVRPDPRRGRADLLPERHQHQRAALRGGYRQDRGEPYQAASATMEQGAVRSPVELRAMTPRLPAMSAPLVVAGTWLRSAEPDGVVLEASFAQAVHVGVGMRIRVNGIDGIRGPGDAGDRHRGHRRPGLLPAVDARPDLGAAQAADPGGAEPERDPGDRRPAPVRQLHGGHRPGRADHLDPVQRHRRVLGRRALLHLAAGQGLDGQQRPAARAAARPVRDHRPDRRPVRDRQRHGGPRAGAASGHRDAQGPGLHPRAGGPDAARPADPARRGRGRPGADRRPGDDAADVRPAAGRHAGGPGPAVRRLDGADRGGYRAHRRDRHGRPGLVGGPGVAGRRRPAEPAPRPSVADRPAQPALPPARRARARGQGLADPAAVRGADRVRPGHPAGDDHDRADLLVDHRRLHQRPGPDRPGRAGHGQPGRPVQQADADPDRPGRPGARGLSRRPVRHPAAR